MTDAEHAAVLRRLMSVPPSPLGNADLAAIERAIKLLDDETSCEFCGETRRSARR